jgi:hypothetical protein
VIPLSRHSALLADAAAAAAIPLVNELETYGEHFVSYLRFDLSAVTGTILSANLHLHASWIGDSNGKAMAADVRPPRVG